MKTNLLLWIQYIKLTHYQYNITYFDTTAYDSFSSNISSFGSSVNVSRFKFLSDVTFSVTVLQRPLHKIIFENIGEKIFGPKTGNNKMTENIN
jgi:hypothetical protein